MLKIIQITQSSDIPLNNNNNNNEAYIMLVLIEQDGVTFNF